jgi:hypothetical protein
MLRAMPSLRRHEGWLYVDQGFGPDMSRHGLTELPCFTCCHCSSIVVMNVQRTRPRGYCPKCDHYTCDHAVCATECHPISQSLALAQKYPDTGEPFLLRGPAGELLHDRRYIDTERIY